MFIFFPYFPLNMYTRLGITQLNTYYGIYVQNGNTINRLNSKISRYFGLSCKIAHPLLYSKHSQTWNTKWKTYHDVYFPHCWRETQAIAITRRGSARLKLRARNRWGAGGVYLPSAAAGRPYPRLRGLFRHIFKKLVE